MIRNAIALMGVFISLEVFAETVVVQPGQKVVVQANPCPKECKPGHCVTHPKRRAKCAKHCNAEVNRACNTKVVHPTIIVPGPIFPRPHPHRWNVIRHPHHHGRR